jgi:hypothetical protein
LQHQQAQALSQAPSLSGLLYDSQQQPHSSFVHPLGGGVWGDAGKDQRLPLAVRLKLPADGAAEGSLLPVQLLRKYIAYAREHVHPVLSDEAKDILQVGNSRCSRSVQAVRCCPAGRKQMPRAQSCPKH